MSYDFGYQPGQVSVHLTSGADFVQSLSTSDGSDWPTGTSISLVLTPNGGSPVTWPTTISGPTAAWNVDHTQIDALGGAGTRLRVRLLYSDGAGTELTWMTGNVVWHG